VVVAAHGRPLMLADRSSRLVFFSNQLQRREWWQIMTPVPGPK
jgi:hypothetical protein